MDTALLETEQDRVAQLLHAAPEWEAAPTNRLVRVLLGEGHFAAYAWELAWAPAEVAGHLRDSALVFSERVRRLRVEEAPLLAGFDPLEPARVVGYRAAGRLALLAELADAQRLLRSTLAAVPAEQAARAGLRSDGVPVRIEDVAAFLPAHQADHRRQLEWLTGARLRPAPTRG